MSQFDPVGTKKSGYAPPGLGPFECEHCEHYDAGLCDHPDVEADPEVKKSTDGRGIVEAEGCCTYYRPGFPKTGMMISLLKKREM